MKRRLIIIAILLAGTVYALTPQEQVDVWRLKARILDTEDRLRATETILSQVVSLVAEHGDSTLIAKVKPLAWNVE